MLRWLIAKIGRRAAISDFTKYQLSFEVSTNYEMGQILASASIARKIMQQSKVLTGCFPDEYLSDTRQIYDSDVQKLCEYNLQLVRHQKQLAAQNDDQSQITAVGMTVWILTIRAMALPGCFPYGRHIWKELLRGKSDWGNIMTELGFITEEPTEREIMQLYPVPLLFVPNDDDARLASHHNAAT